MTTGVELRDQGQSDALAADVAVHRGFAEYAREAVDQLLAEGRTFTADDVRARVPEGIEPHSPNTLPALMGALSRSGLIHPVGIAQCTRPSRRAGWMRVWAGVDGRRSA